MGEERDFLRAALMRDERDFLIAALTIFMRQFESSHFFSLKYRPLDVILKDHWELDWKNSPITPTELAEWWTAHKKKELHK